MFCQGPNHWQIEVLDKLALLLPLHYFLFHFTFCSLLYSINVYQKANFQFVQTLFSIRKITRGILDETDIDSYFYHNILDISQFHHRIVLVSKGSNKKSFAFKVIHFCDSKLQQRFLLKEEVSIFKKEIECLFDNLGELLKAFHQADKVSQIPLPKPKFEIGFAKAKDELFSHRYKDIVAHLNSQIRLPFRFEKIKTCVFSSKSLINSFLQKLSTRVTAKSITSTRINFLLLTGVTFLRAIMTYKDKIEENKSPPITVTRT